MKEETENTWPTRRPSRRQRRRSSRSPGRALDLDAELKAFEESERKRLGLDKHVEQWVEDMVGLGFKKSERAKVTMLIGGLTVAQDYLIEGAFKGIGYSVQMLDVPSNEGFQAGKEFGNRGQCNPTYFTVGNLVQYLITLRDKHGMSAEDIVASTSSSRPARAARAASACTSPSTARRSATPASTASASCSSSRRAASSRRPATSSASS